MLERELVEPTLAEAQQLAEALSTDLVELFPQGVSSEACELHHPRPQPEESRTEPNFTRSIVGKEKP